jgi:Glycosyl hydrolases family 2, TIM barrel domain
MKLILFLSVAFTAVVTVSAAPLTNPEPARLDMDFAGIRGANYCAANGHHDEHWLNYDPRETARDLDNAKKIGINQVRVFLSYIAYATNPPAFRSNLLDLARACQARGIGLMPVVPSTRQMVNETNAPYPLSRAWAKELLDTIGNEPSVTFWDVANEPDWPVNAIQPRRIAHARVMAGIFRELDPRRPRTPVVIGFALEPAMEENADVVDVLVFHDYLSTREAIHTNILRAKAFAEKMNMPLINTEIGCTGRADPYDVAIEEYSDAHVGFYIWELMITKYWGNIHGVFYPDGTVRDPSIAAAMLGIYRNRSSNIVMEVPDREGWVTRTVNNSKTWLANTNGAYADGLNLAETAANLLEANQLIAMRDLPTRRVVLLRESEPDPAALRAFLSDLVAKLEPYELPARPAR